MVKKQKGVTLVETVIAMALVAIVSATIFATCQYSINSQEKNQCKCFFINETENVLMCYYSNNSFENALSYLTGTTISLDDTEEENTYTLYYSSNFEYAEKEDASYKLKIDYTVQNSPVVTCNYVSNGGTIYEFGGRNGE